MWTARLKSCSRLFAPAARERFETGLQSLLAVPYLGPRRGLQARKGVDGIASLYHCHARHVFRKTSHPAACASGEPFILKERGPRRIQHSGVRYYQAKRKKKIKPFRSTRCNVIYNTGELCDLSASYSARCTSTRAAATLSRRSSWVLTGGVSSTGRTSRPSTT